MNAYRFVAFIPLMIFGVALVGCRPNTVSATLVPDVPTQVFVEVAEQVYNFYALETDTMLRLRANPPHLAYIAEVRDGTGELAATLSGGGVLQDARVTLPAESGAYEVRIRTEADLGGTVELIVTGNDNPTPTKTDAPLTPKGTVSAPQHAGVCQLRPRLSEISVFDGATIGAQQIGIMREGATLTAGARAASADGKTWYRIRDGARVGWVRMDTVILAGTCDALPMTTPGTPDDPQAVRVTLANDQMAPYDADSYAITLDPATGSSFTEQISYPNGDGIDRLFLTADGLTTERLFTIRIICDGQAAASLRWGTPDNPSLGCDNALNTTYSPSLTRRSLIVTMPAGSAAGGVRYRLEATATAPEDAETFLLPIMRDSGGAVSEAISYPDGDTQDQFVMRVDNLELAPPHNRRDYLVRIACEGANAAGLRWGLSGSAGLGCDDTLNVTLSADQTQQVITVTLPAGSQRGYLAYVLSAVPVAASDRDRYAFGVDRNAGGQFGEVISGPVGDTFDIIDLTAINLTDTPPDNYREYRVTLLCSGAGVEHIRWGLADNPAQGCNTSLALPLLGSANTQTLVIAVADGQSAYVDYTLVAQPILPTPAP
jgi:hypothetical protein